MKQFSSMYMIKVMAQFSKSTFINQEQVFFCFEMSFFSICIGAAMELCASWKHIQKHVP